jgi:hypothetical protein
MTKVDQDHPKAGRLGSGHAEMVGHRAQTQLASIVPIDASTQGV